MASIMSCGGGGGGVTGVGSSNKSGTGIGRVMASLMSCGGGGGGT